MKDEVVTRRGAGLQGQEAALPEDKRTVLEAMRSIEQQRRPGLLAAYFNGSNWVLYDQLSPRWIPRG